MLASTSTQVMIRPAYGDDDAALGRLAALDSAAHVPARPLLVAEVDGLLRAALSLADGSSIADPFFPSARLLALLRTHAAGAPTAVRPRERRQRRQRPSLASS